MTGEAVAMMVLSMLVLWGGLGLAVWNLVTRSKAPEEHYRRDL
jgi:hypothetical protein